MLILVTSAHAADEKPNVHLSEYPWDGRIVFYGSSDVLLGKSNEEAGSYAKEKLLSLGVKENNVGVDSYMVVFVSIFAENDLRLSRINFFVFGQAIRTDRITKLYIDDGKIEEQVKANKVARAVGDYSGLSILWVRNVLVRISEANAIENTSALLDTILQKFADVYAKANPTSE
jgi:hypothetical protein